MENLKFILKSVLCIIFISLIQPVSYASEISKIKSGSYPGLMSKIKQEMPKSSAHGVTIYRPMITNYIAFAKNIISKESPIDNFYWLNNVDYIKHSNELQIRTSSFNDTLQVEFHLDEQENKVTIFTIDIETGQREYYTNEENLSQGDYKITIQKTDKMKLLTIVCNGRTNAFKIK